MTAPRSSTCPLCKGSGRTRTRTFNADAFRPGARPEKVTFQTCNNCGGSGEVSTR